MTNEDKVRAAGDALMRSLMKLHPNYHGPTCDHCAAFMAWLDVVSPIGGEAA